MGDAPHDRYEKIPAPKDPVALTQGWKEFAKRRDGMLFAMSGGLWMHRHVWFGRPMAHLVSVDREALLEWGARVGMPESRLQFHPLKDPRDGTVRDAWHWDLAGPFLPPRQSAPE
jgi:hypothetical protein